jgi:hypothetical protein
MYERVSLSAFPDSPAPSKDSVLGGGASGSAGGSKCGCNNVGGMSPVSKCCSRGAEPRRPDEARA